MSTSRIVLLSAFATPLRSGAEACAEEVSLRLKDRYDITMVAARMRRDLPRRATLSSNSSPASSGSAQAGGGAHSTTPSVHIIRIGFGHPVDKWLFPFLAPFVVRKLKPDIVHAVLESFAGLAMVFCRFLCPSAKRLLTCQSTNTKLFLPFMHRSADRVTVISCVLLERAKSFGRADAVLIPNGVSCASIREACVRVPKVPGRILFVGRLEPMKGVDTLLSALRLVSERRPEPVDVRIVGDGSLRRILEAQSRSFLPGDDDVFGGYVPVPQVFDEFAAAGIFVGLSRTEALGNVFLEAQAAGCAVVATRVGGIPDVVKDGETGFLITPDDPEAAARVLMQLLDDAALRGRMGEAGRANAAGYDWDAIAERYGEEYQRML